MSGRRATVGVIKAAGAFLVSVGSPCGAGGGARLLSSRFGTVQLSTPPCLWRSACGLSKLSCPFGSAILPSSFSSGFACAASESGPAMTSSSSDMAADSHAAPAAAAPTAGNRFKIYTKTGDKGLSSLYDGQRRMKDDVTFEALGDVDEVNSALGFAHEYCSQACISTLVEQVEEIQSRLLDVGSAIATPLNSGSASKLARVKFDATCVEKLEQWIDSMDDQLPPLSNFILPSGGLPAAAFHLARSVCRRAERRVVSLVAQGAVEPSVSIYLNRLSDYLFTAARFSAMTLKKPETIWRK